MQIEKELKYSFIIYLSLKLINLLFKFKFDHYLLITYFVSLFSMDNLEKIFMPKIKTYVPRVLFEGIIKYFTLKRLIGCNDIFKVILYQEAGDLFIKKIKI